MSICISVMLLAPCGLLSMHVQLIIVSETQYYYSWYKVIASSPDFPVFAQPKKAGKSADEANKVMLAQPYWVSR